MSYKNTKSFKAFIDSPYRSIKHKSYFHAYDNLLEEYIGKDITFIEVGVLDGGSLFMWQDFFGDKARIIGIEINESAKIWRDHGFEIFIGSQSDPIFWRDLFTQVGKVDVVLDDGGHTYQQQIVTVESCLPNIKNGGKIIVEDTYTSYQKEYGYPSKNSFINYAANLVDGINLRTPKVDNKRSNKNISNISFFESIVSITVADESELAIAEGIKNNGAILDKHADSLRYADKPSLTKFENLISSFKSLQNFPVLGKLFKSIGLLTTNFVKLLNNKIDNKKLKKYFRY
tara:strand:+ start:416 stop:1276 length:861 start_codon:yes stop_codon:yes gene_type:complete